MEYSAEKTSFNHNPIVTLSEISATISYLSMPIKYFGFIFDFATLFNRILSYRFAVKYAIE